MRVNSETKPPGCAPPHFGFDFSHRNYVSYIGEIACHKKTPKLDVSHTEKRLLMCLQNL